MKILDFTTEPQFLEGDTIAPEGAAFSLQVIDAAGGEFDAGGYRLIVAIHGACEVTVGEQTQVAAQGQAVAITAEEGLAHATTTGRAIAVLAS